MSGIYRYSVYVPIDKHNYIEIVILLFNSCIDDMQKQILVYLLGVAFLVIFVHCRVPLASVDDDDSNDKLRAKRTATSCSSSTTQQTFMTESLNQHNKWRAAHCAPSIKLDANLATSAQTHAAYIASIDELTHSVLDGVGENLYWAWSSNKMTTADGE
jgi:hypothetical protein